MAQTSSLSSSTDVPKISRQVSVTTLKLNGAMTERFVTVSQRAVFKPSSVLDELIIKKKP